MSQTIRVRRGTEPELNQILLNVAELGFCIDTKEVYVGDGEHNIYVGRAIRDLIANRPTAGVSGRFFDAVDENKIYIDTGSAWRAITFSSLDGVPDGVTYGKIRNSQLFSGLLKQIRAVDSDLSLTGDQINTHLNDAQKHRTINDGGIGNTDLWSADKINTTKANLVSNPIGGNIVVVKTDGNIEDSGYKLNDSGVSSYDLLSAAKIYFEITARLAGLAWKDPAIAFNMVSDMDGMGSPPGNPIIGDAYVVNNWGTGFSNRELREWDGESWVLLKVIEENDIVLVKNTNASGSFLSQENKIATYTGTSWEFIDPVDGWAILVNGDNSIFENNGYTFANNTWIQFTGAGQIIASVGLSKLGNSLSVNLGAGIKENPVDYIGIDLALNEGLKLTTDDDTGQLAIDYDNSSIGITATKLSILFNGVTADHINSSAVGDGLTGGSGSPIAVNAGDGLQILSQALALKLKDSGGVGVDSEGVYTKLSDFGLEMVNGTLVINAGNFVD